MKPEPGPEAGGEPARRSVEHFMIRVLLPDDPEGREVSGLVERLGTGEKQPFATGADLLRLVAAWPDGTL